MTPAPNPAAGILDQHIQRLQNIQPFNIYSVSPEGAVAEWYPITGEVVRDLILYHFDVETQLSVVSAQIMHWGRLTSQAQRVCEIEERKFRQWKAKQYLAGIEGQDKKPSDKVLEAQYRTHPEYDVLSRAVERAAEAASSAQYVVDAFKAKKDALIRFARMSRDQMGPNY